MAHSYISCLVHYVFSTKDRRKIITADLAERLYPYMGGIARQHDLTALAIGGMSDHVHVFLSLPSTTSMAKAIQQIKGASSKWVHDTFPSRRDFQWQEGYGAFSTGISQAADTAQYIQKQKEHHRRKTFQEEFISFPEKHDIEYDPRYVWG